MNKFLKSTFRKYLQSNRGNALVEFALILPLLLLFVVPVIDFGTVSYNKVKLRTAMSAGVNSIMGVTSDESEIQAKIQSAIPLKSSTVSVSKYCECSDNLPASCTAICLDLKSPDRYYDITVTSSVNILGYYGIVANPYPISETVTVMGQ